MRLVLICSTLFVSVVLSASIVIKNEVSLEKNTHGALTRRKLNITALRAKLAKDLNVPLHKLDETVKAILSG
ncbi:hypothetical protein G6F56_003273 [Rhizopus delemar]|nr:hypothetical protein G6F56_003273 [Rhizopus delemar]